MLNCNSSSPAILPTQMTQTLNSTAQHDSKSQAPHYPFIDALRGWAILGVILVHCSIEVQPASELLLRIMRQGAKGVQLFFIASAFTLCASWSSRSQFDNRPITSFIIRRFFRIAPMFYLSALVYLLLNGLTRSYWAPNGISWQAIISTLSFTHGFHPESINSVVPGGWSIAVEMTFYSIAPFLFKSTRSTSRAIKILAACFLAQKINQLISPKLFDYPKDQQYIVDNFIELNFLSQLPYFGCGIICYWVIQDRAINGNRFKNTSYLIPFFYLALCSLSQPTQSTLIAGGIFSMILISSYTNPQILIVNKITNKIGKLSYSLYLTHFAVIILLKQSEFFRNLNHTNIGSLCFFGAILTLSTAAALITNKFIESPGISAGSILITRLK